MTETDRCPECGAELSAGASPEEYCLRCLLNLGLAGETDDETPQATRGEPELASAATELTDSGALARIGHWRILQKLGEGGMGEVYAAEQEQPIRRKVALKLVKAGMDTRQVVARFESERQALALMNHPNIARVFEGGATEQGRPFFVMEYVSGVPITEYCDRHRLTTPERLRLFIQVCEGAQHAHHKGIIHRDIKPSNVLVALQDGTPVPKIIDFGVAKATEQRLTEKSLHTGIGMLIGTPEYMSPEQAEMTDLDIDTRTDVYSLGVLLYELLTGALPFESEELRRAALDEVCRRIREEEPSKPSARVSTLGSASIEMAGYRKTDPSSLARELRGELDWITMKALEKDRTRRYGSPVEFAADIRRYLRHEPVQAGPPSAIYRARKFVRRHKLGVGFLVVLGLFLVGFTIRETIQSRKISAERDRANKEAATALRVSDFLVDLFEVADPGEARGKSITALEILRRGAESIESELQDQPLVQARLLHTLGEVLTNLGLYAEAEPLLEQASRMRREMLGSEHSDTLDSLAERAWLCVKLRRYEEAERLYVEVLTVQRRLRGEDDLHTADARGKLGNLYRVQGRHAEAEPLLVEALARQRELADKSRRTLSTTVNLGVLYRAQGRYAEAEELLREALEGFRGLLGQDHPSTLVTGAQLAWLSIKLGRYDEAERLYVEVLEGRRRILGQDHPNTLDSQNALANLYRIQGRYDEAEPLFVETLATQRQLLRQTRAPLATMVNLGVLFGAQGRNEEAAELLREALEGHKRLLGEDHPGTLVTMSSLADVCASQGRDEEAARLLRDVIERRRRVLGEEHSDTLRSLVRLANLRKKQGRDDDAERLYTEVLESSRRVLRKDHPDTLSCLYNLAELATRRRDIDRAIGFLRETVNLGFSDVEALRTASLEPLHGHAEFELLVAEVEQRASASR